MKKLWTGLLSLTLVASLAGCGGNEAPAEEPANKEENVPAEKTETADEGTEVRSVAYLVNGNLGDKSFFDSANEGLKQLEEDGRITLKVLELGGTDQDKPKWKESLYELSDTEEYDLIVCGTYQMPDFLKEVATAYPEQKYLIFDDDTYVGENDNVVNVVYKQNDLGYIIGTFAASMTTDTDVERINPEKVLGFVGGMDSPIINDFMVGYISGALAVDPDMKIDTRYTEDYVDTAKAKEFGNSMINDSKCDIIWGVAGNAGNGAAEAILDTGKGWYIGVDSDQEQTFSDDLAAVTFTSGLKNIGNSLIWIMDQWDEGKTYWGEKVSLGYADGGVGIVTDKNYEKYASEETKAAVQAAIDGITDGSIEVPSAFDEGGNTAAQELRDEVRP